MSGINRLAVPFLVGLLAVGLLGVAVARTDSGVVAEVRVWQEVDDPQNLHVSARARGGSWETMGTVPLSLTSGVSSDGRYRYGDFTVPSAQPAGETDDGVITGVVYIRDGATKLPDGSVVTVRLVDITATNDDPVALGEQVIAGVGRLPLEFQVPYDPEAIEPYRLYTLVAAVHHEGRLLYLTEVVHPVLSYDYPADSDVAVVLPAESASSLPAIESR